MPASYCRCPLLSIDSVIAIKKKKVSSVFPPLLPKKHFAISWSCAFKPYFDRGKPPLAKFFSVVAVVISVLAYCDRTLCYGYFSYGLAWWSRWWFFKNKSTVRRWRCPVLQKKKIRFIYIHAVCRSSMSLVTFKRIKLPLEEEKERGEVTKIVINTILFEPSEIITTAVNSSITHGGYLRSFLSLDAFWI